MNGIVIGKVEKSLSDTQPTVVNSLTIRPYQASVDISQYRGLALQGASTIIIIIFPQAKYIMRSGNIITDVSYRLTHPNNASAICTINFNNQTITANSVEFCTFYAW
ncbi:MAG TPA: hypothetical protein DCW90_08585 [Lachnospiraceae bacterium]|nr:hypothetical protein [Lachnospiraceae bacterium]